MSSQTVTRISPLIQSTAELLPASGAAPRAPGVDRYFATSLFALLRGASSRVGIAELRDSLSRALPRNVLDDDTISRLAAKLLDLADENGDGDVSVDELEALIGRFPVLLSLLSGDAAPAASPKDSSSAPRRSTRTPREQSFCARTAWAPLGCGAPTRQRVIWVALIVAAIVASAAGQAARYADKGPGMALARAGGAALYLCVFILQATMLRRTWALAARSPTLSYIFPLDALTSAHIAAGVGALVALPLHVGGHAAYWYSAQEDADYVFSARNPEGLVGVRGAAATGVFLALLFFAAAAGFAARIYCHKFAAFSVTHAAVPFVWLLFVLHAPDGGATLALPLFIFCVELALRAAQACAPPTRIFSASLLAGDAIELRVARPPGFHFLPGQFVWLAIDDPAFGRRNYHPFAISSPPEAVEALVFHIRVASPKGWTARLRKFVEERVERGARAASKRNLLARGGSNARSFRNALVDGVAGGVSRRDLFGNDSSSPLNCLGERDVLVRIDGPYPAPCQGVLFVPHAVLVAAGVGITPAASILASILARSRGGRAAAEAIGGARDSSGVAALRPLQRLDFVWLASSGDSFKWFVSLLELYEDAVSADAHLRDALRVHVFLTQLPRPESAADARAALVHLALDALFADQGVDVVVGLRGARAQGGRPDWDELLGQFADDGCGELPQVFVCGPPALGAAVSQAAARQGLAAHVDPY